jgi:hypothetical protein
VQQVAQYMEFNAISVTFAGVMDYLAQHLAVGWGCVVVFFIKVLIIKG